MPRAKKRTYNTRLIRRDYSYEVRELVELFGLHPNTVRLWLRQGLRSIDAHRPTLIHGSDLIDFLGGRQTRRRRPCQLNEFFCCGCRRPTPPWENLVDIEIRDDRRLVLKAVCSECGSALNRIGSVRKIEEYRGAFEIQATTDRRLSG
ncbi:MAG: hypothetical protein ACRED5_20215 [Propylenella sp.]